MRILLAMFLLVASNARAQSDADAEVRRLHGEMTRLAQKTAWSGVDRSYRSMVALEVPLSGDIHLMAAQASIAEGDALKALLRLQRVMTAKVETEEEVEQTAKSEAESALQRLATRYGPVSLSVGTGRDPTLSRPDTPFAPDEKVAIERATARLAEDRVFRGLLPVGRYVIDGVEFEVVAGEEWQSVVLAAIDL